MYLDTQEIRLLKVAILVAVVLTCLAGCAGEAEESTSAGREFKVDKLFTHEGCTVYRFWDASNYRYFTNCRGTVSWQESCGKGCTRPQQVQGGLL